MLLFLAALMLFATGQEAQAHHCSKINMTEGAGPIGDTHAHEGPDKCTQTYCVREHHVKTGRHGSRGGYQGAPAELEDNFGDCYFRDNTKNDPPNPEPSKADHDFFTSSCEVPDPQTEGFCVEPLFDNSFDVNLCNPDVDGDCSGAETEIPRCPPCAKWSDYWNGCLLIRTQDYAAYNATLDEDDPNRCFEDDPDVDDDLPPLDENAGWRGDCGPGVFGYDSADIWPSRTGCYNPEERFAKKVGEREGEPKVIPGHWSTRYWDETEQRYKFARWVDERTTYPGLYVPRDDVLNLDASCVGGDIALDTDRDFDTGGRAEVIQCFQDDYLDDFDNFCRDYTGGLSTSPYLDIRVQWEWTGSCWEKVAHEDQVMAAPVPGEHYMPLALTARYANGVEVPLLPGRAHDYVTYGEYGARTTYNQNEGNLSIRKGGGPYGLYTDSDDVMDVVVTPPFDPWAFDPFNIYQKTPAPSAEEVLDRRNLGTKLKKSECLKVYLEEWAHRGDCGEIVLEHAPTGYGLGHCQWVAMYKASDDMEFPLHIGANRRERGMRNEYYDYENFLSAGAVPLNTDYDICKKPVLPGTGEKFFNEEGLDFSKRGCPSVDGPDHWPEVFQLCDTNVGAERLNTITRTGSSFVDGMLDQLMQGVGWLTADRYESHQILPVNKSLVKILPPLPYMYVQIPPLPPSYGVSPNPANPATLTLKTLFQGMMAFMGLGGWQNIFPPPFDMVQPAWPLLTGGPGVIPSMDAAAGGDYSNIKFMGMPVNNPLAILMPWTVDYQQDWLDYSLPARDCHHYFINDAWDQSMDFPTMADISHDAVSQMRWEYGLKQFGGFRLLESGGKVYAYAPNLPTLESQYKGSFWCEFEVPYSPYYSGMNDELYLKTPLISHWQINDNAPQKKLKLKFHMVERIRTGCSAFSMRTGWQKSSDMKYRYLSNWLLGSENPDASSPCANWQGFYKRKYNEPVISSWRLPRFDYEFLKSFIQCTGPVRTLAEENIPSACNPDFILGDEIHLSAFMGPAAYATMLEVMRWVCIGVNAAEALGHIDAAKEALESESDNPEAGTTGGQAPPQGGQQQGGGISANTMGQLMAAMHGYMAYKYIKAAIDCKNNKKAEFLDFLPTDMAGKINDVCLDLMWASFVLVQIPAFGTVPNPFYNPAMAAPILVNGDACTGGAMVLWGIMNKEAGKAFKEMKKRSERAAARESGGSVDPNESTVDWEEPEEPYGFWCECPPDDMRTTRCNENFCTCEQHVLMNGVFMGSATEGLPTISVCKDYGPYKRWLQCYYQARAKACPVLTRDISNGIAPSTAVRYETLKVNISDDPSGGTVDNVCAVTEAQHSGSLRMSIDPENIRWSGEEPNILAKLPVKYESGGFGHKHPDLVFQSAVRDVEAPYMEPTIPYPVEVMSEEEVEKYGIDTSRLYGVGPARTDTEQRVKDFYEEKYNQGVKAMSEVFRERDVSSWPTVDNQDWRIGSRAQEAVVGIRGCDIGGKHELELAQARSIKWFGLNCLPDAKVTFAEGMSEAYVLKRGGVMIPVAYPVLEDEGSDNASWRVETNYILWPLMGRGFPSPDYASDALPGAHLWDKINNNKVPDWLEMQQREDTPLHLTYKGLSEARPGDFLILDESINNEDGTDARQRRHVAYVEETNTVYKTDLDGNFVNAQGDVITADSLEKVLIKEPTWVKVSEWNWGKYQDSCGGTNRWKTKTLRYLHQEEHGPYGKRGACDNPDLADCYEKNWLRIKLYRPYLDAAYNHPSRPICTANDLPPLITSKALDEADVPLPGWGEGYQSDKTYGQYAVNESKIVDSGYWKRAVASEGKFFDAAAVTEFLKDKIGTCEPPIHLRRSLAPDLPKRSIRTNLTKSAPRDCLHPEGCPREDTSIPAIGPGDAGLGRISVPMDPYNLLGGFNFDGICTLLGPYQGMCEEVLGCVGNHICKKQCPSGDADCEAQCNATAQCTVVNCVDNPGWETCKQLCRALPYDSVSGDGHPACSMVDCIDEFRDQDGTWLSEGCCAAMDLMDDTPDKREMQAVCMSAVDFERCLNTYRDGDAQANPPVPAGKVSQACCSSIDYIQQAFPTGGDAETVRTMRNACYAYVNGEQCLRALREGTIDIDEAECGCAPGNVCPDECLQDPNCTCGQCGYQCFGGNTTDLCVCRSDKGVAPGTLTDECCGALHLVIEAAEDNVKPEVAQMAIGACNAVVDIQQCVRDFKFGTAQNQIGRMSGQCCDALHLLRYVEGAPYQDMLNACKFIVDTTQCLRTYKEGNPTTNPPIPPQTITPQCCQAIDRMEVLFEQGDASTSGLDFYDVRRACRGVLDAQACYRNFTQGEDQQACFCPDNSGYCSYTGVCKEQTGSSPDPSGDPKVDGATCFRDNTGTCGKTCVMNESRTACIGGPGCHMETIVAGDVCVDDGSRNISYEYCDFDTGSTCDVACDCKSLPNGTPKYTITDQCCRAITQVSYVAGADRAIASDMYNMCNAAVDATRCYSNWKHGVTNPVTGQMEIPPGRMTEQCCRVLDRIERTTMAGARGEMSDITDACYAAIDIAHCVDVWNGAYADANPPIPEKTVSADCCSATERLTNMLGQGHEMVQACEGAMNLQSCIRHYRTERSEVSSSLVCESECQLESHLCPPGVCDKNCCPGVFLAEDSCSEVQCEKVEVTTQYTDFEAIQSQCCDVVENVGFVAGISVRDVQELKGQCNAGRLASNCWLRWTDPGTPSTNPNYPEPANDISPECCAVLDEVSRLDGVSATDMRPYQQACQGFSVGVTCYQNYMRDINPEDGQPDRYLPEQCCDALDIVAPVIPEDSRTSILQDMQHLCSASFSALDCVRNYYVGSGSQAAQNESCQCLDGTSSFPYTSCQCDPDDPLCRCYSCDRSCDETVNPSGMCQCQYSVPSQGPVRQMNPRCCGMLDDIGLAVGDPNDPVVQDMRTLCYGVEAAQDCIFEYNRDLDADGNPDRIMSPQCCNALGALEPVVPHETYQNMQQQCRVGLGAANCIQLWESMDGNPGTPEQSNQVVQQCCTIAPLMDDPTLLLWCQGPRGLNCGSPGNVIPPVAQPACCYLFNSEANTQNWSCASVCPDGSPPSTAPPYLCPPPVF